jgi:hypothetical protein
LIAKQAIRPGVAAEHTLAVLMGVAPDAADAAPATPPVSAAARLNVLSTAAPTVPRRATARPLDVMDNLIVDPFGSTREPEGDIAIGGLRVTMTQPMRRKHPKFVKPPLPEEVPQVSPRQRRSP